ncbi:MAG: hydrogenase nickel incorporation protein HypA [Coriobacteriaceae bacterium]|nr:hydrogenase nickel incorporation protein HypA [Coriobacteriaceae bacterium]
MHEAGITRTIIDTAVEAVEEEGGTRINQIDVTVGELTDFVDDALQFAFEAMKADTIASDAVLVISRLPARSRCVMPECTTEFEHGRFDIECPKCGNPFNELVQGRELRIDRIDFD